MSTDLVVAGELGVQDVANQVAKVQELMGQLMKKDEHYGVIPGTGEKPTLYKAGAEKLGFMFRLAPDFDVRREDLPDGHREYEIVCSLRHLGTGAIVGQGVGLCSTLESKYRYRNAARKCPACGNETIIKGKAEYGGGWVCFKKKGGCGATFGDDDPAIVNQTVGKVENPDIADTYNTVMKMAKKRSHVDAIITATAASDIFTQDIEDFRGHAGSDGTPGSETPRASGSNGNGRPPKQNGNNGSSHASGERHATGSNGSSNDTFTRIINLVNTGAVNASQKPEVMKRARSARGNEVQLQEILYSLEHPDEHGLSEDVRDVTPEPHEADLF